IAPEGIAAKVTKGIAPKVANNYLTKEDDGKKMYIHIYSDDGVSVEMTNNEGISAFEGLAETCHNHSDTGGGTLKRPGFILDQQSMNCTHRSIVILEITGLCLPHAHAA
ncbi:hypothetical protein Tco_0985682, partial [Tanacetum coccineum]